jgi:hypothetical protein
MVNIIHGLLWLQRLTRCCLAAVLEFFRIPPQNLGRYVSVFTFQSVASAITLTTFLAEMGVHVTLQRRLKQEIVSYPNAHTFQSSLAFCSRQIAVQSNEHSTKMDKLLVN